MKKLVIGCSLALVLCVIAASAGFYYFVYRPARTFVASISQIGDVAELDAKVVNTTAFTAPADGRLSEAQVRRFVSVQESLQARMGTKATQLQVKYKAIQERKDAGVALADVVGAYRDLFDVIAEAKKAQVDALNAQALSLNEYAWVKTRFYEAAGVSATGIDLREMVSRVQSGDLDAVQGLLRDAGEAMQGAVSSAPRAPEATKAGQDAPSPGTDTPGAGIPDINKALVAPFTAKVPTWMVYSAFGL